MKSLCKKIYDWWAIKDSSFFQLAFSWVAIIFIVQGNSRLQDGRTWRNSKSVMEYSEGWHLPPPFIFHCLFSCYMAMPGCKRTWEMVSLFWMAMCPNNVWLFNDQNRKREWVRAVRGNDIWPRAKMSLDQEVLGEWNSTAVNNSWLNKWDRA